MKCKYAWSHLDLKSGGFAPCFRFKRNDFIESDIDKLPSQVINNADFVKVRQQLRNDEWPAGCIDCQIQEESGLSSYRTRSLENTIHTDPDYESDTIHIKDLQLKMTRACNYKCRHCDTSSNSRFEQTGKDNPTIELKLKKDFNFSHISPPTNKIDIPDDRVMDDLFDNVLPTVENIEFSGGEPFYTRDMYKTLQRMIDDPRIDTKKISLVYNSNMSILEYKGWSIKTLWPHFKRVSVTVSLDGTGDLFNYFRTDGDYQTVLKNIVEVAPLVHNFLFVCTTSAYHAFYMNEIYNDFLDIKKLIPTKKVNIRTTFVHWPQAMDIVNLEEDVKDKILEELVVNDFTAEFAKRLKGKRTLEEPKFKELVRLQDELYDVSCKTLAPKVWDYIND
jgi:MoaA/NifB/PqqE/SkfB family radical SAM enzyme